MERNSKFYALIARNERLFTRYLLLCASVIALILFAGLATLMVQSWPSLQHTGFSILTQHSWDPITLEFGALVFILGTLITSLLALLISLPFSLAIAIFLTQVMARGPLSTLVKTAIELMAAIPSVIYGLWGLTVVVPLMQAWQIKFALLPYGVGIFTAAIVLAIMIIPYSAALSREMLALVPRDLKEVAYALGATPYEVVRHIILPYAKSGIASAILLALGRALGETMAVTMVIGNSSEFPRSLFAPGNTLASLIAGEFAEASGQLYTSTLMLMALILFLITAMINVVAKILIARTAIPRGK